MIEGTLCLADAWMYTDRLTDELCWILSLTVDSTTSVN